LPEQRLRAALLNGLRRRKFDRKGFDFIGGLAAQKNQRAADDRRRPVETADSHRFARGRRAQNSLPISAPRLAKGALNFNSRPLASLCGCPPQRADLGLAAQRWTAFNSGASCEGMRLVAQVVRFPFALMHSSHLLVDRLAMRTLAAAVL
jgi:hypothetical protein